MVSVQVFRSGTGRPVEGVRVCVSFDGLFRGMSDDKYTDSSGLVHFNNDPGPGEIYVDGSKVHEGRLEGVTVVYTR